MRRLWLLLLVGLKQDFTHPDRWLSPLFFGFAIQLVFTFSRGSLPDSYQAQYLVTSFFITLFLALQTSLQRSFELDLRDRVFDTLRSMPLAASSWFFAKWLQVTILSLLIALPLMLSSKIFFENAQVSLLHPLIFLSTCAAIIGLSAIGVLLALLVASTDAKAILFPLLFFPLTTPILLASLELSRSIIEGQLSFSNALQSWLGLLLIVDAVALSLGVLLFNEYLKPDA